MASFGIATGDTKVNLGIELMRDNCILLYILLILILHCYMLVIVNM